MFSPAYALIVAALKELSKRGLVPCFLSTFLNDMPGDSQKLSLCSFAGKIWFCASTSAFSQERPGSPVFFAQSCLVTIRRLDCHCLRHIQCDRVPPTPSKAFCAAPLLSCQHLGRGQSQGRMDAILRLSTRKQPPPPNGPDLHTRDFSCE